MAEPNEQDRTAARELSSRHHLGPIAELAIAQALASARADGVKEGLERAAECIEAFASEEARQPAAAGETAIAYALRSVVAGLRVAGGRVRALKGTT